MYRWDSGPALVQTVDFFTPIVDDPYVYGQIAAANAVSDIYAMGGRPLTALAIAAFPKEGLEAGVIKAIFRGGFDKLREAGVALLGGHTVQDTEIKFGYAVTGSIDPTRILANGGAREGDVLFLTKPLGTGIVGTAIKFDRVDPALADEAVHSMRTLNRAAAEALQTLPAGAIHSCTDITGFGLIGHASEMAKASRVTVTIEAGSVPVFTGVLAIAAANRSGGLGSNQEHFADAVHVDPGVDQDREAILYDPQTSGGLLVAASGEAANRVAAAFQAAGVAATRVGTVGVARPGIHIVVRS
ncbi:MAG: Selenide, water dikinase SelD [Acidobacteria bacterium]|nr:Selenide, water dikinase SelD [Acidobacteriota bacterium]